LPRTKNTSSPAGADRVDRDQRPAGRLVIGCQRLDDEQLDPDEVLVLAGRDHVADDTGQLHYSFTSIASMMPTIAASTGTVLQTRRHARRAAADDEHGFADAGVRPCPRDEIVAFDFAAGIDAAHDHQFVADEAGIFSGGDNRADDLREEHEPTPSRRWPFRSAARLRGSRAGAG
jgi:hypothetical protein